MQFTQAEKLLIKDALKEERLRLSSIDNVVQRDLSKFTEARRERIFKLKELESKF